MKKKKLILCNPMHGGVGFAQKKISRYPPLGLGIIASLTPPDWEVVIRDANFEDIRAEPCDLVGISMIISQAYHGYRIASEFREKGIPVVLGGVHPTTCTDEALQYADSVVKGEAELLWNTVINDFENGSLKKIYESETYAESLEHVPPAAHHLFNDEYSWGIVSASRGCPMHCEFCIVSGFSGPQYRKRPVEDILDEIELIKQKTIIIADPNMLGNGEEDEEQFIKLCEGMIKRKLKKLWICQASINFSRSDDALKAAKAAGCIAVLIGIESPSLVVLEGNMKKENNVNYILKGEFVKRIHKHGINVIGQFILGNDEEGQYSYHELAEYIEKYEIDIPSFTFLTPFPGTKLWNRLAQENRMPSFNFPKDWSLFIATNGAMLDSLSLKKDEINKLSIRLIKNIYSLRKILMRVLKSFLRSKGSILIFFVILKGNLSFKNRHINASYFREK